MSGEWRYNSIFDLGSRWKGLSASRFSRFTPRGRALGTRYIWGLVSESIWTTVNREMSPAPVGNRTLIVQPDIADKTKLKCFFFLIFIAILLSIIMAILSLCPKELNIFITWKIMKSDDRNIKNWGDDLQSCWATSPGMLLLFYMLLRNEKFPAIRTCCLTAY